MFYLIAGTGHCGTKWLAHVLNRPSEGMVCFHEQKVKIFDGINYRAILQYEDLHGIGSMFQPYFSFLYNQHREYEIVGDSNSWAMRNIPAFDRVWPVDIVVLLIRNGIQCVHSMHNTDLYWDKSNWIYTHFLRQYWELLDQPLFEDWDTLSPWEYWCFNWSLNLRMALYLKEHLGEDRVIVCRLEDLTHDAQCLENLLRRINPRLDINKREIHTLQQTDVNRKIKGDRDPIVLWNQWPPNFQAVFRNVCQDAMSFYEYSIPWV